MFCIVAASLGAWSTSLTRPSVDHHLQSEYWMFLSIFAFLKGLGCQLASLVASWIIEMRGWGLSVLSSWIYFWGGLVFKPSLSWQLRSEVHQLGDLFWLTEASFLDTPTSLASCFAPASSSGRSPVSQTGLLGLSSAIFCRLEIYHAAMAWASACSGLSSPQSSSRRSFR